MFFPNEKNKEKNDGEKVVGSKAISSLMIEEINSCLIAEGVSTFKIVYVYIDPYRLSEKLRSVDKSSFGL